MVPRAWGPHRTQHWDLTSALATSSLTGDVPKISLRRAWWAAWDPRGPVPALELGEHVPHGLWIHPVSPPSPSVLSERRKMTSTGHCVRCRLCPVDVRIL